MSGAEEFQWLWYCPEAQPDVGHYVSRGRITIDLVEVAVAAEADNMKPSIATQVWLKGSREPHILGVSYGDFLKRWHPQ